MTAKQIAISLLFAVLMTVVTVWWSGDYSISNVLILSAIGGSIGFLWTSFMRRRGYL